jgi:hypothetical protein
MEHTNTICGQNAENLYIETGGTLDIKGLTTLLFLVAQPTDVRNSGVTL